MNILESQVLKFKACKRVSTNAIARMLNADKRTTSSSNQSLVILGISDLPSTFAANSQSMKHFPSSFSCCGDEMIEQSSGGLSKDSLSGPGFDPVPVLELDDVSPRISMTW